ncbi:MAG TPA: hypothetical protein VFF03_15850 [Rhodocyclaceae bacterium]|nr:hypothetical protein [Rhodocyclaceae bacterium]
MESTAVRAPAKAHDVLAQYVRTASQLHTHMDRIRRNHAEIHGSLSRAAAALRSISRKK